jgi:hypothetical protein
MEGPARFFSRLGNSAASSATAFNEAAASVSGDIESTCARISRKRCASLSTRPKGDEQSLHYCRVLEPEGFNDPPSHWRPTEDEET